MADVGFNGSTVTFNGAQIPLRDIDVSHDAAKVDITGAGDAVKTFLAGQKDSTITFTVVGTTDLVVGGTYAITVAWNDGESDAFTTGVVTGLTTSGSLDGEVTTSITVVPAS
jgi:hypothetical protein